MRRSCIAMAPSRASSAALAPRPPFGLHALRVLETCEPLLLRILPGDAVGEAGAGDGAVTVKNPCLSGGALEIFLEPRLPPATIRVVGQSPIAVALADLGKGSAIPSS